MWNNVPTSHEIPRGIPGGTLFFTLSNPNYLLLPPPQVLPVLVANLAYHAEFLKKNLPQDRAIFGTYLFRTEGLISSLLPHITCDPKVSRCMTPTGVPSTNFLMQQLDDIRDVITSGFQEMKEGDSLTKEGLEHCLEQVLQKFHPNPGQSASAVTATGPTAAIAGSSRTAERRYLWATPSKKRKHGDRGNDLQAKFHKLPKDWKLPAADLKQAYELWYAGNKAYGIPALRLVEGTDFSLRREQQQFSDWRCFFVGLESITEGFTVPETPAEIAAGYCEALHAVKKVIPVRKRKQREGQLALHTLIRHMRKYLKIQKQRREQEAEE